MYGLDELTGNMRMVPEGPGAPSAPGKPARPGGPCEKKREEEKREGKQKEMSHKACGKLMCKWLYKKKEHYRHVSLKFKIQGKYCRIILNCWLGHLNQLKIPKQFTKTKA